MTRPRDPSDRPPSVREILLIIGATVVVIVLAVLIKSH